MSVDDNQKEGEQLTDELYGISARMLLSKLKTSKILKANEELKQKGRGLMELAVLHINYPFNEPIPKELKNAL